MASYEVCLQISAKCPIEATIYGYYPSLGANAFFIAFFAALFVANLGLGIWAKTWSFMAALLLSSASEAIGYGGRVMMHNNPWDNNAFIIQICCIIIGPAFNTAAIYLTLKHIVLTFGPEWSRIRPSLYTWIFIGCDLISLVLQAVGGAMASTANGNMQQLDNGDNIALTGICFQVVTLFFFAVMTVEFALRRTKLVRNGTAPLSPSAQSTLNSTKFRIFAAATLFAYITIFTRCVYRIAEFSAGWQNPIMQNETLFIVLEGVMIALAAFAQTVAHPGIFFPPLASGYRHTKESNSPSEIAL